MPTTSVVLISPNEVKMAQLQEDFAEIQKIIDGRIRVPAFSATGLKEPSLTS